MLRRNKMHECEKKECKHEHLKFCPKCQKLSCVDCGKELQEKCTLNHYPNYYPYSPWSQPWSQPVTIYGKTIAGDKNYFEVTWTG